jgi:hypothetical protein
MTKKKNKNKNKYRVNGKRQGKRKHVRNWKKKKNLINVVQKTIAKLKASEGPSEGGGEWAQVVVWTTFSVFLPLSSSIQ